MSQQFRTVTTNAGRNAVREALTQGKTVKLSHMSVGDGGGQPRDAAFHNDEARERTVPRPDQ